LRSSQLRRDPHEPLRLAAEDQSYAARGLGARALRLVIDSAQGPHTAERSRGGASNLKERSLGEQRGQAKGPIVSTTTSLGRTLADARGRTLYLFEKDKSGKSTCVGMCATFWPPLIATGKPVAASGTRSSMLGTTKRADGRLQVTYNHHPLYTFAKDTKKGQTNGEGVIAFGGQWFAVSPAGARIPKPDNSSTTTTSPGYGY
jgi:predicted lipoprotein with Yx(FWY)xxD motif